MTWNAEGILSSRRELALLNILNDNDVDVGIITETEIPTSSHGDFNVPHVSPRDPLGAVEDGQISRNGRGAVRNGCTFYDLMQPTVQMIWVQVDLGNSFLVGGLYREWSDLPWEYMDHTKIKDQLQAAASEVDNIVFAGDLNHDTARRCDMRYGRRCLMLAQNNAIAEAT
jgi:hypothetical protein